MPVRINHTGRKKITRDHARIGIEKDPAGLYFNASLDLAALKLDPQAFVFVEAYRQTAWMRFPYGRVGAMTEPPLKERRLTQFDVPEGVLFRVKVTADGEGRGKLLAEADTLRPKKPGEQDGDAIPLIDPVPAKLNGEVWRVSWEEPPQLLINEDFQGWKDLVLDTQFRSVVAPAVMRQILTRMLLLEKNKGEEGSEDWRTRWVTFAASLPGVGEPPPDLEQEQGVWDWIDKAVEAFCQRSGMFDGFLQSWKKEAKS
jgi:hypothetical protein